MSSIQVYNFPNSAVLYLYSIREEIKIDPDYQRRGEIWTKDKRQLLIDSIINGFDIPKIYLHDLSNIPQAGGKRYAIIDGRQRLESIWLFIDGEFGLSSDFEYLQDKKIKASGLTYKELGEKYPKIKVLFDSITLSVVVVKTSDTDLIDEMFSRLNEAVPLSAAEKRNAFRGPLPKIIREIAIHEFFKEKLSISNKRYQHRDLAAKFLLLAHEEKPADTKKAYLDEFVKSFRSSSPAELKPTIKKVRGILDNMNHIFIKKDSLLRSSGMAVLYFLLFMERIDVKRSILEKFEAVREKNRKIAEENIAKANYDWLEFDKYMQTPNDAYAIKLRVDILKKFLGSSQQDILNR